MDAGRVGGYKQGRFHDEGREMSVSKGNKERILDAAKRLFGELGYADTTYKRIAQEAGIADGLIAHHYGSKEFLFQLVELSILSDLMHQIDESLYYASDGLGRTLNFARCILKVSVAPDSGFLTLLRCSPLLTQTTTGDNSEILSKCRQIVEKMLTCLREGQADGSIRTDLNVELAASVILSTVFGSTRARLLVRENILGLSFTDDFYPEIMHILRKYLHAG